MRLADGRDYKAVLVGVSPSHDIAVLKIAVDFKRPPPVPIGESYRGVLPFLVSDVVRTALLLLFPGVSLWLVKFVG